MLFGALFLKYAFKIENKFGIKKTIFLLNIIPAIAYILMSFIITPTYAILFYIIIYSLSFMRNPIFSQYQNDHIESKNRATTLSLISMINSIYFIISQLVIGVIANYNLLLSFFIMGIIILISSIIFKIDESHIKNKKY